MLNIAFCDDDPDYLLKISSDTKKILMDLRISNQINTYVDGHSLINDFKRYQPYFDIVFLDIHMPVINGKEVARRLRTFDKTFKLVFITAYEEEALDTLQYNVSGFIPKRRIDQNLPDIIQRVVNTISEDRPQIQIFKVEAGYDRKMIIKIPINDIMFFESINRKIYLYTKRETFTLHGYKFSDVIEQYMPLGFVHIRRTCLVNVRYIFSIDDLEVCLDNGVHLPISRRKKQLIIDSFLDLVGS